MPGYEPKLQMVEQLRSEYFVNFSKNPKSIFEDINAVPLNYLNDALAANRIVDDEYEFFIPSSP